MSLSRAAELIEVLRQLQQNDLGVVPRRVEMVGACRNECHDNAAAYAAIHGGELVRGYLHEGSGRYVLHSLVYMAGDLVDPTPMDAVPFSFFRVPGVLRSDPEELMDLTHQFDLSEFHDLLPPDVARDAN